MDHGPSLIGFQQERKGKLWGTLLWAMIDETLVILLVQVCLRRPLDRVRGRLHLVSARMRVFQFLHLDPSLLRVFAPFLQLAIAHTKDFLS